MYAGIDPGKKGAMVIIDENGIITNQFVIPVIDGDVALEILCFQLGNFKKLGVKHVVLEEPGVLFGVGKTSMYVMGRVLGNLEAALSCKGISYTLAKPKLWQKQVWKPEDKLTKNPKEISLNAVHRLYPGASFLYGDNEKNSGRRTKVHDGLVDAALIAQYCKLLNS